MMRSDSDLDEVESVQEEPTMMAENEESPNDEQEETEPTTDDSTTDKAASKKEWRKLWRSQKIYWRERENEADNKCDERDEVEQDGAPSGGDKEGGEEAHDSLNDDDQEDATQTEGESAVAEDSDVVDSSTNQIFATQSPKKGWRLLKRIQQRRAQAKGKEQGQTEEEEEGENNDNNEEEETALWRDILFTIGSLTDDENGHSTDEDLNKSLDDIEEQILRQAGIENENEDGGSGAIPPSPWSSLRRLRDKIKENSASVAEEEVAFFEDDEQVDAGIAQLDAGENDQVDDSRDEASDAPRAWASLKRLRDKIKENASTDKEEQTDDNDNGDQNSDDIEATATSDDDANGDEVLEAPSTWSSLKRFRDRIKENSVPEGKADESVESMDENGETTAFEEDGGDDTHENSESNNEIGDESNTRRWGVLDRIRKKVDVDNNESIEDQIESLAKELEKEQQKSGLSFANENTDDDTHPEEDTQEDQEETNNAPRKGWALFKRVQDRLTAEKAVDDETDGYENIDEAFAFRTFHVLHTRNQELEDLVERLQRANEILKAECKLTTVKVDELTKIIEAKDGNCAEDVLLRKSIENAELLMQVDELQVELDKANSSVQSLKVENKEHKRLVNGMGRVLDALHSTHVDDSSSSVPSMGPTGELSIDNLEPKIEQIMEDREQLVLRCSHLERENELKDEQIEKLSEALDAQSFHYASVEKVKGDDESVQSELTRSTYTGTSVSSSSIESDDNNNSRLRNLYNSVSSKVMSGNMEIVEEDNPYFDTETLCADNDDASSVNAIQGQGDDLESIKKRLNKSDPKYVEFLSLMGEQGMVLESVPSGEATECPNERPEQETTSRDEIICELVI
mmetsp:Transcript_16611/g.40550  ORF Transcript_16611/g.40550 Transcript_16611/m.40550 type:complete len:858 (-) Transcript_16611:788-3361(-)